MNVAETAAASGVAANMIRYYQGMELIPAAARRQAAYRISSEAEVRTLCLIHRSRERLLALWQHSKCTSVEVKQLAPEHLEALRRKFAGLVAVQQSVEHLTSHCHSDNRPECPNLDELSGDHAAAARV